ncbi:MAG: FHA domain-containing protein [Anaerolineae bacterium]|nr:FHA domain-containing protein [Anaerolineae bacterium]
MKDDKTLGTRPLHDRTPEQPKAPSSSRNRILERLLAVKGDAQASDAPPTQVVLHIREMAEQITLTEGRFAVIGRTDYGLGGFQPDLDLTKYGGQERGVSRVHARLHVSNGTLYVTDLYSANGTFVAGEKLEPEKPRALEDGAEFVVGSLSIRIEMV